MHTKGLLSLGALLTLITADITLPAHSSEAQIEVAGAILPNVFEPGGNGPYNVIYQQVTTGVPVTPNLTLMPTKRAQRSFYTKESDCLFVATALERIYRDRGLDMADIILSTPVYNHPMRVYSRPNTTVVRDANHMSGERIAVDAAAVSSEGAKTLTIPEDAVIIPASTTEQAFSLLATGRVDHLVAFQFDVEALGQRLPRIREYPHDPGFFLIRNPEVFACHRTPATEAFIAHINKVLDDMRADQTLATLFSTKTDLAR